MRPLIGYTAELDLNSGALGAVSAQGWEPFLTQAGNDRTRPEKPDTSIFYKIIQLLIGNFPDPWKDYGLVRAIYTEAHADNYFACKLANFIFISKLRVYTKLEKAGLRHKMHKYYLTQENVQISIHE